MLAICGGRPVREKPFPGWPVVTEQDRQALSRVLESGDLHSDAEQKDFEKRYARDTGAEHCFLVANGTVSLELILRGYGIGYGDEVIIPPYTFIATLSSVVFTGAKPVFADIDPGTYNLSPEDTEKKITKKTKAVVAVAVAGCPPDLDALSEICKRHGLRLIIDAAQAVGAAWKGIPLGSLGDAASVSCQNSKNLTCGEGGIITTNDGALAERISLMLNGGSDGKAFVCAGEDHGVSRFQASILLSQYEKLESELYIREKNAASLSGRLAKLDFIRPQAYDPRITRHAYHLYLVRLDRGILAQSGIDRNRFLEAVQAEGIPLCAGYAPLYDFPCCRSELTGQMIGGEIDTAPLPEAQKAGYEEGAWLYQSVLLGTREDMDDIANAILKVYEGLRKPGEV